MRDSASLVIALCVGGLLVTLAFCLPALRARIDYTAHRLRLPERPRRKGL